MPWHIFSELSSLALRALDDAHVNGFRALMDGISRGECGQQKLSPSDALVHLQDSLNQNFPTDYDDPHVAAAYMVSYHLSHCMMAYWSFSQLFRRVGIPNELYVCDIGAGTGAGVVGMQLALSVRRATPRVYFDYCEPSLAMRYAGISFIAKLPDHLNSTYIGNHLRDVASVPDSLPDGLSENALRVVSAFHLSLPYDSQFCVTDLTEVRRSLQDAMDLTKPHACLFTCHRNKLESLS